MISLAQKQGIFLTFLWAICLSFAYSPHIWADERSAGKAEEAVIFQGDDEDKKSLAEAVESSLKYLELRISSLKAAEHFPKKDSLLYSFQESRKTLQRFQKIIKENLSPQEFAQKIKSNFFFREVNKEGILLTGYFEPIYSGRLKEEGEYRYPLYRPPDDLVEKKIKKGNMLTQEKLFGRWERGSFVPYYSRKEIDTHGILKGRGYEIVWLKDPWERFLLHVQGSGKIILPDGQICRIGYAATNGRPYRSIGRYLVSKHFIKEEELSLRKVREFLQQNTEIMEEILNLNERYIFFRFTSFLSAPEGPMGALDFSLIPGRSIATDHSIYPPGGLAYLISTLPIIDETGRVLGRKKINRFVLNQDKGAAMKGPARVDLFIGSGERAEQIAGEMKEEGKIYTIRAK